jgi:hypothetical protein
MEVFVGIVALIAGLEIGGVVENSKCEDKIKQIKMTMVIPKCEPIVKTVYPSDISYIVDLKKNQVMILDKEMTEKVLKLKIGKSK